MKSQFKSRIAAAIAFLSGSLMLAQGGPPPQPPAPPQPGAAAAAPQPPVPPQPPGMGRGMGPAMPGMPPPPGRPPMERAMSRWWNNRQLAERLGLSGEQIRRIEDIFQQHRLRLIDLNATLQKAEVTLEPMMAADQPDEAKIVAQIDRVAQARAELEKANARMLLGIRQVLTPEQWKKLEQERPGTASGAGRGAGSGAGRGPGRPQE